ncbi:uncharacterized protein LOC124817286 [Hydra vulgaris]|uniref:uncharacterized protein LOC124817286 n=1 Tax=Hydra vulgaris TaxID=6087 RepID=UPI001F5F8D5F|nr:uncharacterized protein LOC124817286 [Hydra vulgaris]
MKRNYPSGWEKMKKKKLKNNNYNGCRVQYLNLLKGHCPRQTTKEGPESLEGPCTSYGQRNEQTSNEEQEKREEEQYKRQEEEDIIILIRSELDANSVHESEDLTLNYDVGNWPTPMLDYLRTDVIRQGSEIYQNLEGPFDPVHKPGENSKGQTKQLTKSWFYKKLPSGEQILRKWMVYSHEKKITVLLSLQATGKTLVTSWNRGNFLELVSLLSNYDHVLKEHSIRLQQLLESGLITVSYLSPSVQNEFISLLGDAVKQESICEIKKAKFYGILLDSTPDIFHTEQMSQVIRYAKIDNRNVEVKESFLGFIPLSGKKADSITQEIVQSLEKDGLDLKLCRSQGYDNATTMSGIHTGVNQN